MSTLKLGTRGSQLALYQANLVAARLAQHTSTECEIVVVKTSGDRMAEAALSEVGGKRLFVKELEDALLAGTIDLAVHSSKDMPATLPDGLDIGAVLAREDARDAIVLPNGAGGPLTVEEVTRELGRSPRIGTSSVRRSAQLTRLFPGATFRPIRGNLDTRLRKLDAGDFDAIVLACAGLRRLDQAVRISAELPVDACVPAPGQGIIAIEIRSDDARVSKIVAAINDDEAAIALTAERIVVRRLGGGCQMPIGVYAHVASDMISVKGIVVSIDGARAARAEVRGQSTAPELVGAEAAEQLLARGADEILADIERTHGSVQGLQP